MIDTDTLRERIREQDESSRDTFCPNCQATLTATDREAGYCTQCHTEIDDVDDEFDEDLADDDYDNY